MFNAVSKLICSNNSKFCSRISSFAHCLTTRRHKHDIPKHLQNIATEKDPNFAHMVEYYYHNAAKIMEPSLIEELTEKYPKLCKRSIEARVSGLLRFMGYVSTCIEVNFPLMNSKSEIEIITGYRAHHMKQRLPVKGGTYVIFFFCNWVARYTLHHYVVHSSVVLRRCTQKQFMFRKIQIVALIR